LTEPTLKEIQIKDVHYAILGVIVAVFLGFMFLVVFSLVVKQNYLYSPGYQHLVVSCYEKHGELNRDGDCVIPAP